MAFQAYIFFSGGSCAAAFERYCEVFGGDLTIMRMSEAPADARPADVDPQSVMHASLVVGDGVLAGSDDPTGDGGAKRGFAVSYTAADADEARRVFDALAEGGEVTMDLAPTFWAAAFGMCVDPFGVPWMIDTAGSAPSA